MNPYKDENIEVKKYGILRDDDEEPCATEHEKSRRAEYVVLVSNESDLDGNMNGIKFCVCEECFKKDRAVELYKRELEEEDEDRFLNNLQKRLWN